MGAFQRFGTFFVVPLAIEKFVNGVGVSHVWRITTADDPSERHWCDDEGQIAMVRYGGAGRRNGSTNGLRIAKQIIIEGRSEEVADKVSSLIRIGTLLSYPDLLRYPNVAGTYPIAQVDHTSVTTSPLVDRFHQYESAHYGCHAAARAWKHSEVIYALEKYLFSLERDWFTPHSGDPSHRQIFPNRYREEAYHVRAAFAIVAAFSAIEELGLEPRSSKQRPRFIGAGKNRWNPGVLRDLETRLTTAGVNPDETEIWLRRGAPTQVEHEMRPKLGRSASWNKRFGVRDRELRMADAIHYVSWLRNFVAAHKFRAIASAVSPYDVHNAQGVARRLLLGRLGLWRRF